MDLDSQIKAFKSYFEGRIVRLFALLPCSSLALTQTPTNQDFIGQEQVEKTSRNILWSSMARSLFPLALAHTSLTG